MRVRGEDRDDRKRHEERRGGTRKPEHHTILYCARSIEKPIART
jgi:hypothetical protein